jgi:hypothetical protein
MYQLCGGETTTKIKIAAFWHKILVEIYSALKNTASSDKMNNK